MTRYHATCLAVLLATAACLCADKPGTEKEIAGIKLCWCPPGTFLMGSPPKEPDRRADEAQVKVTLTKGFWTAKYETTQGQWERVVGKLPGKATAELPEDDDMPVGDVNFAQAEAFCAKLTELGRKDGTLPKDWEFRLPTEAQWEYACRAGTKTATSFGDKLSTKQANFKDKPYNGAEEGPSVGKAVKVGRYPANAWGLHGMHGNTFEWCRDWYHAKLPGGTTPTCTTRRRRPRRTGTGPCPESAAAGVRPHRVPGSCRSALVLPAERLSGRFHLGAVLLRPLPYSAEGFAEALAQRGEGVIDVGRDDRADGAGDQPVRLHLPDRLGEHL